MSHSQDVKAPVAGQPADNNTYNPHAYYWGSATVSFAALMELLKCMEEAYNDMAKCSMTTTNAQATAVITTANAAQATYNDDAATTRFQANEQWASMGTSLFGMGANLGMSLASNANTEQAKLGNLKLAQNQMKDVTGVQNQQAGNLPAIVRNSPEAQAYLENARNETIIPKRNENGTVINPKAAEAAQDKNFIRRLWNREKTVKDTNFFTDKGIDEVVNPNGSMPRNGPSENEIKIRDVLDSASTEEVAAFKKTLAADIRTQTQVILDAHQDITNKNQIFSMITQGSNSGLSAHFKGAEAKMMEQKGADSADQARAQAGQEFMRETNQSQQQQYGQYADKSTKVFDSLNQMIQVDTHV